MGTENKETTQNKSSLVQMTFAENGNIKPCPFTDNCMTYKIGCQGESWWCKQRGIGNEIKYNNSILQHGNNDGRTSVRS